MDVTEMRLEKYSENDIVLYKSLVFNEETMGMNLGRPFTEEEAAFFFQAVLEQNAEGDEYGFYKVFIGDPDNIYSRRILLKKGFVSVKQYRNDEGEPAELFHLKRQYMNDIALKRL